MRTRIATCLVLLLAFGSVAWAEDRLVVWSQGQVQCRLVMPPGDQRTAGLVRSTLSDYTRQLGDFSLPAAEDPLQPGNYLVAGTPENNPLMAKLVNQGAKLTKEEIGEEGFQLLTCQDGPSRYVIVFGKTPRAIKHGCQELLFYHLSATATSTAIDWPLDVVMKPAFAYRGVYILPCWAAHDSLESWQRVLRFNSEITINRNWFWLDGFPVAGHTGEYGGTPLADEKNVQGLIDLCNKEEMKFLIGGGWFNWHHGKAVGKDYAKGLDYYLAYLRAFKGFHGFYIEPTGEGGEIKDWRPECDKLRELSGTVLKQRPDFEFAIAIGKFNNSEYLKLMSQLDPKRVYWWWCWGDPFRDKALELYPSVLRWHTIVRMWNFHGSNDPPLPSERPLAGVATSYDPGQGFGNPWNGWGKLGVDKPRNFDPYEVPYFGHEYFYRERCWNPDLSEADFVKRLHRRLFDADAPQDAGEQYWRLTQLTLQTSAKSRPKPEQLAPIRAFLETLRGRRFTPRTADTIHRMDETMGHLVRISQQTGK